MVRIISKMIKRLTEQRGAVLPLVAILIFVLVGFAAFAIDLGYLHVVRNELQNAADAGALAGVERLFNPDGTLDATDAFGAAKNTSTLNKSGVNAVPTPTVSIGHYAFASDPSQPGTFNSLCSTSSPSCPAQDSGWVSTFETSGFSGLNADTHFINAVGVTLSRTDVPRFFSQIFGSSAFTVTVQAVAILGGASGRSFGQPIAICWDAISSGFCTDGRMINSSGGSNTNTAAWSNLTQPTSCTQQAADANSLKQIVCNGSDNSLNSWAPLETTNGQVSSVFGNNNDGLYACWLAHCNSSGPVTDPEQCNQPFQMTLPIITCPNYPGPITSCEPVIGSVTVNAVWIWTTTGGKGLKGGSPQQMGGQYSDPNTGEAYNVVPDSCVASQRNNVTGSPPMWACPATCTSSPPSGESTDECCWNSFVSCFSLKDSSGNNYYVPSPYADSNLDFTIFFLPECFGSTPTGPNLYTFTRYPHLVTNLNFAP